MTDEQIELAGRIRKVVRLANLPGMDAVAVKLNCGLTYDETREARNWWKAFELAQKGGKLFELAGQYEKASR